MAYLDLNADHPFTGAATAPRATKLVPQERLVVQMSRSDPLWSLRSRQERSRLLNLVFGIEAPHRLADRRLEALRRYAVMYRLRDASATGAEEAAGAVGFSRCQLEQVRAMIDGAGTTYRPARVFMLIQRSALLIAAALILYGLTC